MSFVLSEKDIARLKRLLDAFESGNLKPKQQQQVASKPATYDVCYVKLTEDIDAVDNGVASSGEAKLRKHRRDSDTWTDTEYVFPVFNDSESDLKNFDSIQIFRDPTSGRWFPLAAPASIKMGFAAIDINKASVGGTGMGLGSGQITFMTQDASNGRWVSTGNTESVNNPFELAILEGSLLWVTKLEGIWIIVNAACKGSDLSGIPLES